MVNAKQRKRRREKASAYSATAAVAATSTHIEAGAIAQQSQPAQREDNRPAAASATAVTPNVASTRDIIVQTQPQRPPHLSSLLGSKKFVTASDGTLYHDLLRDHYAGFCLLPAAHVTLPPSDGDSSRGSGTNTAVDFHARSKVALERLRDMGYYQYDMVMAGGQNLSRTFVQRTLVGNPGLTYKYLGLRLFCHAWSGPGTSDALREIHTLNQAMIDLTKVQLRNHNRNGISNANCVGSSCEYNLTLINYMEPSSETLLREEEIYGMGKASVSWHADSSLQDYSCIGVYHTLPTQKAGCTWDWKIALRPNPTENQDEPTVAMAPPVVVPTRSGDVYFLLGDFNHKHQHMVLAGSAAKRISSTHRVAVTDTDTYEYIAQRCSTALKTSKAELKNHDSMADWNVHILLEAQAVLTEVEFEWIAQYWIQGAQHDVQHVWWQAPIRALEQAWAALERITLKVYSKCCSGLASNHPYVLSAPPPTELVLGLLAALKLRQERRLKWDERRADKIYKRRISRPFQPVEHPLFDGNDANRRLPKNLDEAIGNLSRVVVTVNSRGNSHAPVKQSELGMVDKSPSFRKNPSMSNRAPKKLKQPR